MSTTYQNVKVAEKEGKAFLRKVIRQNREAVFMGGWSVHASPENDWKMLFRRRIEKGVGEPEEWVEVQTDAEIRVSRRTGAIQPFADASEVQVATPKRVYVNGDSSNVAQLLLSGYDFRVEASAGSTNSSRHGLSFYSLEATKQELTHYSLTVGTQTVAKDGETLIGGAVDIY